MEDYLNGRRPQWKMTSMEDDLNGRRPQWKTTSVEDDPYGGRPQGKRISGEEHLYGIVSWMSTPMEALKEADDISLPSLPILY